jgi:hypothetical protein
MAVAQLWCASGSSSSGTGNTEKDGQAGRQQGGRERRRSAQEDRRQSGRWMSTVPAVVRWACGRGALGRGWSAKRTQQRERQKEGEGREGKGRRGQTSSFIRSLLCASSDGPVPLRLLPSGIMPPPAAVPLLTTPCTQVRRQAQLCAATDTDLIHILFADLRPRVASCLPLCLSALPSAAAGAC